MQSLEAACSPLPLPLQAGRGLAGPAPHFHRSRFPAPPRPCSKDRGGPAGTHLSLAAAPPLELPGPARLLPQAAILEKGFANVSAERGSGWRGSAEGGEAGFGSRLPKAAGKRSPVGGRRGIPGNGRLLSHKLQTPAILAVKGRVVRGREKRERCRLGNGVPRPGKAVGGAGGKNYLSQGRAGEGRAHVSAARGRGRRKNKVLATLQRADEGAFGRSSGSAHFARLSQWEPGTSFSRVFGFRALVCHGKLIIE